MVFSELRDRRFWPPIILVPQNRALYSNQMRLDKEGEWLGPLCSTAEVYTALGSEVKVKLNRSNLPLWKATHGKSGEGGESHRKGKTKVRLESFNVRRPV